MRTDPPMLNRRAFLRSTGALVTGALAARWRPGPHLRTAQAAGEPTLTTAWQWMLSPQDLTPAASAAGRRRRVHALSQPTAMPQAFNALGASLLPGSPNEAPWQLEFRASYDGRLWTPWVAAPVLAPGSGPTGAQLLGTTTDVVGLAGRWVQVRLCLPVNASPQQARTHFSGRGVVTLISSADGPGGSSITRTVQRSPSSMFQLAAFAVPTIVSRAAWGADESLRFSNGREVWPPRLVTPQVFVVHHTVTANDDPDPAATVRAIYYYHARVLGWGDIGYHYLVDSWGNVYEGRVQSPLAEGAHVYGYNRGSIGIALLGNFETGQPSAAALDAVAALVRGLASDYGIDPDGETFFMDGIHPAVAGHRDYLVTACPGQHLYALLPAVRGAAAQRAEYRAEFLQHGLAAQFTAGVETAVPVVLRNAGSDTWQAGTSLPYRLGYRWYDAQGDKYNLEPDLEVHTDLPHDVAPGEQVTVTMTLRVPSLPGVYQVRLDMVHELVTWFEDAGSAPLVVDVDVLPQEAFPEYGAQWLAHGVPTVLTRGRTTFPRVQVRNSGSVTWTRALPDLFRLGYRWYDAEGNKYNLEPTIELRTGLPFDVGPGQTAELRMALRAPVVPGQYLLKIDMVHELVTWFEDAASAPLVLSVQVQ